MKIAIDARELTTSTGRYVERLLYYLQKIDSQHDYLVLLKPADIPKWQPTNPRFTVVACPHREFSFAEQLAFNKQLGKLNPDLVHFAMPQQPVRYRARKITTFHDLTTLRFNNPTKNWLIFKLKQQVYRFVIKSAARHSSAVIAISQYTKDDLVKLTGIDPSKVVVTYEAADKIPVGVEQIHKLAGARFIMYVGRPTPHKNLGRLIDAFGLLVKQQPDLKLVLAGKLDENYQRHQKTVEKRGLGKSVIFTGFVNEAQLRWLYEHTAAYVFPSLSEGFGLPGLEAMVHGAPVAASNVSCLPEIYGDAAHYFDPKDVADMASKIGEVISNQELRAELVSKGYAQAKKYSWQKMAEQTLEIYNQVLTSLK